MESLRRALNGRSGLWSNPDFLSFWKGETISNFGLQLGAITLPIVAAVSLNASPFEMGLLAASGNFPRMVVGIFAGSWVDARKRRPIMMTVNVLRASAMLLIPLAALFGILSFTMLLIISLALGILGIIFDSAWSAMIPDLVARNDLADANGKLWASMRLAQILGPIFAGILIAWFTAPYVLVINSFGWLASAFYMHRIRKPEPEIQTGVHASPKQVIQNIKDGYAELWRNPIVRPLTTTLIGTSFGSGIFSATFVLFLTTELMLSTRSVGIMSAVAGVGALTGSLLAAPLAKRFGVGRIITIGPFLQGTCNLSFAAAVYAHNIGIALVAAGLYVGWVFLQAYDINRFSLRQSATRPNLMGRVASSTMTIIAAVMMIGALVGGTIGELWGLGPALALGALTQIAAGFLTVYSPVPSMRTLPVNEWHAAPEVIPAQPLTSPAPPTAEVA